MMFAVLRLRGTVKVSNDVIDTLAMLRLSRKMHCVLINESPSFNGMIRKVKDYITWGPINDETLKLLVAKRGRMPGNKRLKEGDAEKIVEVIKSGKKPVIVPVFRLSPPSKGFKHSIKHSYPKGELGFRGEEINKLLMRMI